MRTNWFVAERSKHVVRTKVKTLMIRQFGSIRVPVLPMSEQVRIADILDKFDALTTSLQDGLPAEQVARRKQYEYYRDALLTFKEKPVPASAGSTTEEES